MKEIPAYLQRDCHWMRQALEEAHKAAELHEIPVGAVIVYQNEIIARAHNRRELDQDALAHAEVLCIQQACQKLGSWRLSGASCMSHWSLVRCAAVPSSTPGWTGWYTVLRMKSRLLRLRR